MPDRPDVPGDWIDRIDTALADCPDCRSRQAWTGVQWRIGQATVAHVFGGEDQRFRVTFRAADDEVMAFERLGDPYFRAGWGTNVVGMIVDDDTDWTELGELLVESYCVQAPASLVARVDRPTA